MKYLSLLLLRRGCQLNCLEDFDASCLAIQVGRICLIDLSSYFGVFFTMIEVLLVFMSYLTTVDLDILGIRKI